MGFTFLDYAEAVLKKASAPLTYNEIWDKGAQDGFHKKLKTSGKTPHQTLGSRLFVDVRDNPESKFLKIGSRPARFFLRSRSDEVTKTTVQEIEVSERKEKSPHSSYSERDLHVLLTYFAYANPTFGRGKSIYTKTIYHEKSRKHGFNEWLHPDLVGFYLPIEDWNVDVLEFNRISDNNVLTLYSFELKKAINKGNYREAFFQAVSNSSWANEGYLVAAEIKQDDDLLSELERLSLSFGIGIIQLDLEDFDSSKILYHAKAKNSLDWETMNKLSEGNPDFRKFLQDVKIDFESRRIHKSEYDAVITEPEEYISTIKDKKP